MNNTKAIHLNNFNKFVLARSDQATLQRIFRQLSPEDQAVLNQPVLINAWLDYSLWWRLMVAADKILGKGDLQIIREIGAFDARENLRGIYRAFVSFLQPDFIIGRASLIWRRYYDTGDLKPIRITYNSAELWLIDWDNLPPSHELEIIGWMEEALLMTGVKNLHLAHTTCMALGDDHCTFEIKWDFHE